MNCITSYPSLWYFEWFCDRGYKEFQFLGWQSDETIKTYAETNIICLWKVKLK